MHRSWDTSVYFHEEEGAYTVDDEEMDEEAHGSRYCR